jgi:mRNA degradation ribonuclease J1/J2
MRGFVFVKESENIMKEVTQLFTSETQDYLSKRQGQSLDDFKFHLIDKTSKLIKRLNGKNPVIFPLITLHDGE